MPEPTAGHEELARQAATALTRAVDDALPGWVVRSVERRLPAGPGRPAILEEARLAGVRAGQEVGGAVRQLLDLDLDEQRQNPLALIRQAVRFPTGVLRAAGAPPVERDDFSRRRFPHDDYGLVPATWSDVDPALVEPGIAWGAAKAFISRARHG